jgi:cellulose synthase/poly-beta-1,6-N-acetylglucosamine synthase-like glycosyltransferase
MQGYSGLIFWFCFVAAAYPYVIYPLLLICSNRLLRRVLPEADTGFQPTVTIICPVHNEAATIEAKIVDLLALDYPSDRLEILVVGDGCTDETLAVAERAGAPGAIRVVELAQRGGKAAALNAGLERSTADIVVFTDAGIRVDNGALRALAGHFVDPRVGCVSGEDWVEGGGNEGLYGRLELLMRREESKLHSIAGASGCLYAERRELCRPFRAGMAPDFLSVLDTVRAGYRAICEPAARGTMKSATSQRAEFRRKTRTFLRGITALFGNAALLNPFRFPAFSFILVSHKLLRWLAPFALLGCLVTAYLLRDIAVYRIALFLQIVLYSLATAGIAWPFLAARSIIVRLCAFVLLVNGAAAIALLLWLGGTRRETWQPTRRPA